MFGYRKREWRLAFDVSLKYPAKTLEVTGFTISDFELKSLLVNRKEVISLKHLDKSVCSLSTSATTLFISQDRFIVDLIDFPTLFQLVNEVPT